jgi:hypothetical protein
MQSVGYRFCEVFSSPPTVAENAHGEFASPTPLLASSGGRPTASDIREKISMPRFDGASAAIRGHYGRNDPTGETLRADYSDEQGTARVGNLKPRRGKTERNMQGAIEINQ